MSLLFDQKETDVPDVELLNMVLMNTSKKMKILHIITDLDTGGAEMMALKLIDALKSSMNSCVIVLMGRGTLSPQLDDLNVPVRYLELAPGCIPGLNAIRKLVCFVREFRPQVIQGWMYHGNLAACFAKILFYPQPTLIWNIRQTLYLLDNEKGLTELIIKIGARVSWIPSRIIYNSTLSATQHETLGYAKNKRIVIPNGFDLDAFRPDPVQRTKLRTQLGIPPNVQLVGHVARFHPMKGHTTMLCAARMVVNRLEDVCFVFTGFKMSTDNSEVVQLIEALDLVDHVILLGERQDVPVIMNCFDLFVLSSEWGEGFPNVVGEAMATGVPCVVTDVGDSGYVVGDYGRVVSPADSEALATGILEMLALKSDERAQLTTNCRERIASLFSLSRISSAYQDLYNKTTSA